MSSMPDDRRVGVPIGRFFAHVVARYPLARWTLALTFVLLILEYASLSLMIPLSSANASAGTGRNSAIIEAWSTVAGSIGLPPTLMTWLWLFLVLMALRSVAGYVHLCLTTLVSKQVHRELAKSVFGRIVFDEPMAAIYRRTVGFYISLAGDDTFRAGTLVNSALQVLAAVVSVGAGLALLFMFSTTAFQMTLAFLLVSAIGVGLCARRLMRLDVRAVGLSREARTSFLEALNSLRSIRSMSSEAFVHANYAEQMRAYTRLLFLVEVFKNGIKFFPGIVALAIGIVVLAPWRTSPLAYEASTVFAATTILIRVFLSLGALMTAGGALLIDSRAAKDLGILVDMHRGTHADPQLVAPPRPRPVGTIERIDLAGIDYAYEGARSVISGLSLSLQRGHCYAVVGPSGTGKSTLADLLLGLVAPSAGEIRIDGQAVDMADLRSRVILVEQQPRIFSVSVRDNLTLGHATSDAAIAAALSAVEMTSFVESLPRGLDTPLDYQGANLSGGQRQRLSIARALVRQPEVLILDEATSALDGPTEALVLRNVKREMGRGVLVLVTHDPEIASATDEVIDLHNPQASAAPAASVPV
jgi:ABC-type multidrug transport system fused ATPase/permease subunit